MTKLKTLAKIISILVACFLSYRAGAKYGK